MTSSGERRLPKVSVVICTTGRIGFLPQTLDSIRAQTYRPLEIVLVVGPCHDGTDAFAASLLDVNVVPISKLNLSFARNAGIRASGGDIIAFIDDDAVASARWVEELVAAFETSGTQCGGVGGATYNEGESGRPVQFRFGNVSDMGDGSDHSLEPQPQISQDGQWFARLHGTNMAFRRDALLAVGGFDEVYEYCHDETDLCVRMIRAGYRIEQLGRAWVHHYPAPSHNRQGARGKNWYVTFKNNIYFALKHGRRGRLSCILAVVNRHKIWLPVWFNWYRKGAIDSRTLARCLMAFGRGLVNGIALGVSQRRRPASVRQASSLPGIFATTNGQASASPVGQFSTLPGIFGTTSGQARSLSYKQVPAALVKDLERPSFFPIASAAQRSPARPTSRRLRIALVCGEFNSPSAGGIAVYTRHLAEGLSDLGHTVIVLCRGPNLPAQTARSYRTVAISESPQTESFPIEVCRTLLALHAHEPIDMVEAPLWGGEACAIGLAGKIPLVVRLETPTAVVHQLNKSRLTAETAAAIAAERLELSYAAGAIAISRAVAKTVEKLYDLELQTLSRQAAVIPLGIPDVSLPPSSPPNSGGPNFLFVGRLECRKGIEELGEAFIEVARRIPSALLWIVGADNSANDGFARRTGLSYPAWLRERWGAELADRCRFFGSATEAEKNELISRCDVFVAPSRYESFGLVFLEAMRLGKPVVATDVGGIPEVVADRETGLLVPVQSAAALSEAMVRLGKDPAVRERMGAAARQRFVERFSLRVCARQTAAFYGQVLKTWRGAAPLPLAAEPLMRRAA